MDVREAYEEFLHAKLPTSPQTVRGYKFRLAVFASWCSAHGYTLESLTAKHIRQFVEDVSKRHGGLASSTIRQYEQNVFISRTGEALTVHGLAQLIEQLEETSRIRDVRVSPHTFRHTYAVQYLLNGGDIYKLSRLMGHTSVKITERYLQAVNAKQA